MHYVAVCLLYVLCLWPVSAEAELSACTEPLESKEGLVELIFPDGQMNNRLLPVFLTNVYLNPGDGITLRMMDSFPGMSFGKHQDDQLFKAQFVDHNQSWTKNKTMADGTVVQHVYRGTLVVFDVSAFDMPFFRPFAQVLPVVAWQGKDKNGDCQRVLGKGQEKVNIGNAIGVFVHTGMLFFAILLLLAAIAAKRHGSWRGVVNLLCEPEGKLSLSKVQMAIWTLAIVGVVAVYSQTQMTLPEIPWTLLALMGASYATRALAAWKGHSGPVPEVEGEVPAASGRVSPELSQLVCDHQGQLSLPRAQMLVWTILTVAIFVTKSLLDGQMWNVPVELVALMGLSQVGYAVPGMRAGGEPHAAR